MELLEPYKKLNKREHDFVVRYTFYLKDEVGYGRPTLPHQHIRSNFALADQIDPLISHMIFPEFLDAEGNIILENGRRVDKSGIATMWIVPIEYLQYYKDILRVGAKGYFMEGPFKTAECEVIELNWK